MTRRCSRAAARAEARGEGRRPPPQGFAHEVEIEGGHTVVVDEPADAGGADTGPRPTRLLAASLAACTAVTMEMYAERKGWDIGAVEVDVDVEYDGARPASFAVTLRLPDGAERGAAAAAARDRRQVPGPQGARRRDAGHRLRPGRAALDGPRPGGTRPASSPAPAAGSAARRRGCSAPRAPTCCWSPATRSGSPAAVEEAGGGRGRGGRAGRRLALDVTDDGRRRADAGRADRALRRPRRARQQRRRRARWRDLDEVPDEDWRAQYELNVMAPLRAMRAAAPAMAERGWGRIVNVCSTAGKRPSAAMPEYSVAKAAELSLSRLFADRYAKRGVLVNAICPGPVEVGDVDGARRPARPVEARCRARRAARRRSPRPARSGRSAASPRSARSPPRSSSSAPSAPPTSAAPPGRSTAAPSR